eukprot:365486-Chlamydomonas_euryale.AAC.9
MIAKASNGTERLNVVSSCSLAIECSPEGLRRAWRALGELGALHDCRPSRLGARLRACLPPRSAAPR